MIKVRNLWFRYENSSRWTLENINLTIDDGEFVVVAGPNASGKTTLARILVGLIPSFYRGELKGDVEVHNINICKNPEEAFKIVGYLGEDPEVQIVTLTVEDEVAFGPSNLGLDVNEIRERVSWALKVVNGEHLRHRCTFELSIGEAQKVSLASLLALKPKALVLDEPSVFLDKETTRSLYTTLKNLTKKGLTVITIEHNLDNVLSLADKLVLLDRGRIVWYGKTTEHTATDATKLPIPKLTSRTHAPEEILWEENENPTNHSGSENAIINVEKLWFKYPKSERWTLKDITLRVDEGEVLGLLGPNGSGKSTLIKTIIGILKPQCGRVSVLGINPQKEWRKLVGRIGYVPQNPTLSFTSSTVYKELQETAKRLRMESGEDRICEILDLMEMWEYRDTPVLKLSYGFRRRLSIASALIGEPDILVLDEPTAYLDYESRMKLISILKKLKGKVTMIIASHDRYFINKICNKISLMREGRIKHQYGVEK